MKMKKIVLSIALLTVTGNMLAGGSSAMNMMMQGEDRPPTDMLPSKDMQKEAKTLYNTLDMLKVGKDGAITLPADLIEFAKNTFSIARTMTSEEGKKIEQLQMAYAQIDYPWWRNELTSFMGKNVKFMTVLSKYDAVFQAHQNLWNNLNQDISTSHYYVNTSMLYQDIENENKTDAEKTLKQLMTPIVASKEKQDAASKSLDQLFTSSSALKALLTELQDMFKDANKDLEQHIAKIEYLVKQNVQWMIAFGIAINPDFAKVVTTEMTEHLTTTFTNLHTSPKVTKLRTMQEAANDASSRQEVK